jgi:tRNA 2-thiouridine synthesizing protein C
LDKIKVKKYLFILNYAPHHGHHAQATLDILLTTAAFEQPVSLLLLDEAVFQLKKHQQVDLQVYNDTGAIFNALPIYDIHNIYIENESLQTHGLTVSDLLLTVKVYFRKDIANLMQQYDVVFTA